MATHSSILAWRIAQRAWWATVHGVTKSWTRLSDTHTHTHTHARTLVSEQEYGNSPWKVLRECRGVGDLDSGGFAVSGGWESGDKQSLGSLGPFVVMTVCQDKTLIWGHVVRQVTSLRLEWPASGVYLLKFIPGTLIQLQCIYRNGGDRQWEPAGQVCQHFCLVKPCSSHPFTIHSCSRGERCDGRYRKAIAKLVVSRCMPLGQIF